MPETRICTGAPEDNIASRGAGRARRMPPHSPPRGPSPHPRRTTPWRPRTVREAATRISRKVDADIPTAVAAVPAPAPAVDQESREWLRCLRATGAAHDDAVARLHALLLKAARFEVGRRRTTLPHLRGNELDDIALEAADDALMSVLAHLDDFRGLSRFTTWVYKFALLEAAVKLRRRAWQGREVPLEPDVVGSVRERRVDSRTSVRARSELMSTVQRLIARDAHAPSAARARRPGAERRADRRSGRAAGHDPRRALQDAARCPPKTAQGIDRGRARTSNLVEGEDVMENRDLDANARRGCSARRSRRSAATSVSTSSTATSSSSSRPGRRSASPGMRAHLAGCPACREEHESLRALVSADRSTR